MAFSPADAAHKLGISVKALRLYEERGLIAPGRTLAGWRAYSPEDIACARNIIALRKLGLSLDQTARALSGDASGLASALAEHQQTLEARHGETASALARLRTVRENLAGGAAPTLAELVSLQAPTIAAVFDLPWPWGGERFELRQPAAITWLVGPLFSGKTKLAEAIATNLPGARFAGLDRKPGPVTPRIEAALGWLREDGATTDDVLLSVLTHLEADCDGALVFDLIEQSLDEPTQLALSAHLRRRGPDARPIFAMTRSTAMLDLASAGSGEVIIFCPANHSRPIYVAPHPGVSGYEAVATCLAPPDVRARTDGVIAVRPNAA